MRASEFSSAFNLRAREARKLWHLLGADQVGHLAVSQISRHSRNLERVFPDLLRRQKDIAQKGLVQWEDFLTLYDSRLRDNEGRVADEGSLEHVSRVFGHLDPDSLGRVTLHQVILHKEFVEKELPALIEEWDEIDIDHSGGIRWEEFRMYFGSSDEWLEFLFGDIVGLDEMKVQIRRFYRGAALEMFRRERGELLTGVGHHMIFEGSKGSGKSMVARLMSKMLYRVGLLGTDVLTEVERDELVSDIAGNTPAKTERVVECAEGGILLVNEAYLLADDLRGREAIQVLASAMIQPIGISPLVIFCGRPLEIEKVMARHMGLYQRIPFTFSFPDYTTAQLVEILQIECAKSGFELDAGLQESCCHPILEILEAKTMGVQRLLLNGRLCERVFVLARQALDARDDPACPTLVLSKDDIVTACEQIPPPPPHRPDMSTTAHALADEMRAHMEMLKGEIAHLRVEHAQRLGQASTGSILSGVQSVCSVSRTARPIEVAELRLENEQLRKDADRLRTEFLRSSDLSSMGHSIGAPPMISNGSSTQQKQGAEIEHYRRDCGALKVDNERLRVEALAREDRLRATDEENKELLRRGSSFADEKDTEYRLARLRADYEQLKADTTTMRNEANADHERIRNIEAENSALSRRLRLHGLPCMVATDEVANGVRTPEHSTVGRPSRSISPPPRGRRSPSPLPKARLSPSPPPKGRRSPGTPGMVLLSHSGRRSPGTPGLQR